MSAKYAPIIGLLATIIFCGSIIFFQTKTVFDTLSFKNVAMSETAYCSIFDVTKLTGVHLAEPSKEMLSSSNQLFAPLFHQVTVSGPVFYKNTAVNADLINLYISVPQENGTFQTATIELVVSQGESMDTTSVFINIDNRGYHVISGKENILSFIDVTRGDSE